MTTTTRTTSRMTVAASRPGFSLLELTAVLVILGLLAGAAAVAIPAQIERARVKTTKTSMKTIKSQIESYRAENAGEAPATLQVLIPSFMEQGSEFDAWDQPYYYLPTPGQAYAYTLVSKGPDKEQGTEDDINVWTMDVTSGN